MNSEKAYFESAVAGSRCVDKQYECSSMETETDDGG